MSISDQLPGMKPGSMVRNIVVGVVYFFVIIGVLGAMVGPDETSSDDTAPESDADTDEMEDQDEQSSDDSSEDSSDAENSASGDSGESSSNTYSVHVKYSGDWSGSIGADGSSRSVDGSGEQTFDVEGEPTTISVNAPSGTIRSAATATFISMLHVTKHHRGDPTIDHYPLAERTILPRHNTAASAVGRQ